MPDAVAVFGAIIGAASSGINTPLGVWGTTLGLALVVLAGPAALLCEAVAGWLAVDGDPELEPPVEAVAGELTVAFVVGEFTDEVVVGSVTGIDVLDGDAVADGAMVLAGAAGETVCVTAPVLWAVAVTIATVEGVGEGVAVFVAVAVTVAVAVVVVVPFAVAMGVTVLVAVAVVVVVAVGVASFWPP